MCKVKKMALDKAGYFKTRFNQVLRPEGDMPETAKTMSVGEYKELFRFTVGYQFGVDTEPTEEIRLQTESAKASGDFEKILAAADKMASILDGEYQDYLFRHKDDKK